MVSTLSRQQVHPAEVSAVGWGWRHAGRADAALTGLNLHISPGERVLLLGPSGAGKSTLLHGLAGVLGDEEDSDEYGRLQIDGYPAAALRGRAGLMQQDPEASVVLSRIGDDVAFGPENLAVPPAEIWSRVHRALDAVGLNLPLQGPTSKLSGGQKQRLALAGLLAMQPGLLLLDEPTANLDPDGVNQVRDAVVRSLDETAATMVVVEHRVAVWADVVDRMVVLSDEGTVLADGAPARVLDDNRRRLQDAGVWVPGRRPEVEPRHNHGSGVQLLRTLDLSVSREKGRRRHPPRPAAAGINTQVAAGQALSITGPNGAGKSTLALTLAGLLPPVSGHVTASEALAAGAGPDPCTWRPKDLISRIGTVFQEPEHQFVTHRVYDELAFGLRQLHDDGNDAGRVEELLERLRLSHVAGANPFTLSGGEKRRLSVATALAARPDVLVLDEPTFGQDANTWAELASLLNSQLDAGAAVVSVTHDEDFTELLGGSRLHLDAQPERGAGHEQ
ncbi:ABC transporter ATP-binding protein [Arthrobacter castelli]|uniref:ABC transporter ATP-binding protein n=1 Tax=Arthrobacter castelli TaxID=271431 RepID=UPI0003FAFFD0|nr:ATP-binding cassette domain-containing protein [Arthrobacter castelli]